VSRGSWTVVLGVPLALFLVVFLVVRVADVTSGGNAAQLRNPFASAHPFAAPDTLAAAAAKDAAGDDKALLERVAAVPSAVWLTPEAFGVDKVGAFVRSIVRLADRADRVPVFVVYGIPDRDCSGGKSRGGLSVDTYPSWVKAIGAAAGPRAALVLEPDALATADDCGKVDERVGLLRSAVDELASDGPTTYVDAGHANWTSPSDMAALLERVDVDRVRGFATNVSAYQSDAAERAYAEAVSKAVGGAHYVIDTGRNGAGSTDDWCNPPGRALGLTPRVGSGGRLDADLWIKPAGESDGSCNGGPPAGEFWADRLVDMARQAGW
jgi:endoglucanase